jgi:hypothetical protein
MAIETTAEKTFKEAAIVWCAYVMLNFILGFAMYTLITGLGEHG